MLLLNFLTASSLGGGVGFAVRAEGARNASRPAYQGSYSNDAVKFMFYARVLTGDYTQAPNTITYKKELLKAPPHKDPEKSIRYDSVVDDVKVPRQYVVFNNDQSYPEYLITYTGDDRQFL